VIASQHFMVSRNLAKGQFFLPNDRKSFTERDLAFYFLFGTIYAMPIEHGHKSCGQQMSISKFEKESAL
jgi:hypothetical protein